VVIQELWGLMSDTGAREVNSGAVAGIFGLVTGLPSMTWAAMNGDWLPAYAGSATGIGGVIYCIWKQGEDRRLKMMAEAVTAMTMEIGGLRAELKVVREAAEGAEKKAIEDRTALRIENGNLREQLSRNTAAVNRVESIVTNPATTPDPDAAKGAA
jgi:regulator of replication initiation timing